MNGFCAFFLTPAEEAMHPTPHRTAGLSFLATAWILIALLLPRGHCARADNPPTVKEAIAKALPLLVKGGKGHIAERTCFACHNQGVPLLALTTARKRGFSVRDEHIKEQLEHVADFLAKNRDNYRKGKGQGGQVDTAGYALLTLEWGGWKADATTEAVVEYLLRYKKDSDHYPSSGRRPPSEGSPFTTAYVGLRGMRKWGTAEQQERIGHRIQGLRKFLLKTRPRDTEDLVFRLWGLQAAGVKGKELQPAFQELLKSQRKDGGWSQVDGKDSDAYATGSALVALHEAGGLATNDKAYQSGVAYLLKSQLEDGSWLVRSRSRPFQKYYESGFPHGKNQFISMAATGWAVVALALACPDPTKPAQPSRERFSR